MQFSKVVKMGKSALLQLSIPFILIAMQHVILTLVLSSLWAFRLVTRKEATLADVV